MNSESIDPTEPTEPTDEAGPESSAMPTMDDMRSLSAELDTIDEVLGLLDSDPNAISLLGD